MEIMKLKTDVLLCSVCLSHRTLNCIRLKGMGCGNLHTHTHTHSPKLNDDNNNENGQVQIIPLLQMLEMKTISFVTK